ncbi:phosphoketolase [Kytococcus schroeteri]|uniref:Probable phosphoketolase n=1 Tax=Kytococcus schroeteri TaxID=138300 RepID=A0A2I1PAY7_9MICO|nr:phosphoketolase family protein [Kytococcus schroeteri]PKZ41788.1 phosphoketolase [Kytococcus schroeteri]
MTAPTAWPDRPSTPLTAEEAARIHQWWRAANYLSVGQIYLLDNPLLRQPLTEDHVKPRLLGHWGTTPGLTFLYAHMNRAIRQRGLNAFYVTGPGHGGPGLVASTYLEGTYTETYPGITRDEAGLQRLFKQFSFPGGIPSHVSPEVPGSLHEGGELGYALSHAYGAVFDNPDQLAFTVVGDGEAETGPLATAWHSNKFLNPHTDGVVLPVLHLNGYKIANPTVLARIPEDELAALMTGYGHTPLFFTAGFDDEDPISIHQRFAAVLDEALDMIARFKADAAVRAEQGQDPTAAEGSVPQAHRPAWPMIVFRTPKGWTGPAEVDGRQTEGHWRSHQVPLASARDTPEHLRVLEDWLRSYRPEELFDADGALLPEIAATAPEGTARMSANPVTNGGAVLQELELPDFRRYAVPVEERGTEVVEPTRRMGAWLRDVVAANLQNFRVFGPDETASNRLQDVYEVTPKQWMGEYHPNDAGEPLGPSGRVMEVLSEHQCQGWLEGYLLTGRHGLMSSYEAFIHIVDSMFNQHAKWLKVTNGIEWRRPLASLTYLLSSHVWRQDHNGFSHQDPGFIDHVVNKKAEIIRVYLPPDANTLLSTMDHCLRSRQYVNVVVAGKQPTPTWLSMEEAVAHCTRGIGTWEWAGTVRDGELPDVVLACAGDVPTVEVLAAATLLERELPGLRVRVVNVVDLMRLQDSGEHPHGMDRDQFRALFPEGTPVVFAYHGYPWLIHRLVYRNDTGSDFHVRGYREEGTTTTPFDMLMRNDLDRYHLVMDVIDHVPGLRARHAGLRQRMEDKRLEARAHAYAHGVDLPEVAGWQWSDNQDEADAGAAAARMGDTGGDND